MINKVEIIPGEMGFGTLVISTLKALSKLLVRICAYWPITCMVMTRWESQAYIKGE
jgi:hypothetical protein